MSNTIKIIIWENLPTHKFLIFFSQVYIWNVIDSVMNKIKVVQWAWNYFQIAVIDMCAKYLFSKTKYFI